MARNSPATPLAAGIALLMLAGTAPAQSGRTSQAVIDARQEGQISATYALSPYLRADDLGVAVRSGRATLTGAVEDDVKKELAGQIALGVTGVESVDNRITVEPDYQPRRRGADRGSSDIIEDASITAAVKSRLLWNKGTEGMAASVATRGQRVTLSGVAGSAAARDLAGRLALDTRGVTGVDNRLVVGRGGATPVAEGALAERSMSAVISDDWITTKVNASFAYSSNVDGATIDVSTRDGVVTLSGTAASGPERERAIELAGNIRGVRVVESQQLRVL